MVANGMRLLSASPVPGDEAPGAVDEVQLYHRTYTTLLRSSGETLLRVLEPSHRAMRSSLHPAAGEASLDLGALLYALHRLPAGIWTARVVLMGQDLASFEREAGVAAADWPAVEAPARRRRWHTEGSGLFAVLIASSSDVDDLVPTLVAYQIEWNKLHELLDVRTPPAGQADPAWCASELGGLEADWVRVDEAWDGALAGFLRSVAGRELDLRIRMLGGSEVGYARVARRWWDQVQDCLRAEDLGERPIYFVSSNTHSITNLLAGPSRLPAADVLHWVREHGPPYLREELAKLQEGRSKGSWNNFLYYCTRLFLNAHPDASHWREERRRRELAIGIHHLPSRTALRVSAQVMELSRLDATALDARIGPVDAGRLRRCPAVVVNVDYPLGLGAYNVLRQIGESTERLRGVYVLGKAATLNAAVGDVMIPDVVHDEHSGTTYWLDNALSFDDIQPYLMFGSGLDNQHAVTVRSTFLQNRGYLDFYYREAFTIVEMEAGPFCDAVYEIAEIGRYPVGSAVNFSKLPLDFGVIHYASDTPYTQARTLGARGLSYFGMDATYASSVAIVRRILSLEGVQDPGDRPPPAPPPPLG